MLQYQLQISFTQDDLNRFYATGGNIVIAKPLVDGMVDVAWVVFRPLQRNYIEWSDEFGIYASNATVVDGAQLFPNAFTDPNFPVQPGLLYTMSPSGGILGPSSSGGTDGAYSILNSYENPPKGYLTFGMRQAATVDSEVRPLTALSAAAVIQTAKAVMTPQPAVYLWVQSNVASNTVVTVATAPRTRIALDASTPSASMSYDAATGTFVATSGSTPRVTVIPART